jgi:hypothetical protein
MKNSQVAQTSMDQLSKILGCYCMYLLEAICRYIVLKRMRVLKFSSLKLGGLVILTELKIHGTSVIEEADESD